MSRFHLPYFNSSYFTLLDLFRPCTCENGNIEEAEEEVGREFLDTNVEGNSTDAAAPALPIRSNRAPANN